MLFLISILNRYSNLKKYLINLNGQYYAHNVKNCLVLKIIFNAFFIVFYCL